ncbi:MAG: oligosaccharide flippase family protein [Emcibacteraceae bacterium]|nr:oligosaccharide flippase family protein [Emcibacteraceae bacterium]
MEKTSKNNKSLKSRVVVASSWAMAGFGLGQLIRLSSNLIMTRLLVPEMFGLMALCQVFLFIMALISDIGIRPSIIRSDRVDDPRFLNTAWTVQILRGGIITSMVLLAALSINIGNQFNFFTENSAYTSQNLPLIIGVMAFTAFIGSFNSTNTTLAQRKLLLGRLTVLEIASQVFGIILMILWAILVEKNIWALVIGSFGTVILNTILSHTSFPGIRNKIHWDWSAFWEIFHFGKWILLSSVITAILAQGDRFILGNKLSTETLGVYVIAFFLVFSVKQAIQKLNSVVFFPLFNEIKYEKLDKITQIYYNIRCRSDAISMTMAGVLFVSGETIVKLLFDDRYLEAGWMLSALSFSLLFTGTIISGALYFSLNKPKYVSLMSIVEAIALIGGMIYFFDMGGLEFGIWVVAFYSITSIPIDLYIKKKMGILVLYKEFYMLPIALIGCLLGLLFNQLILFTL